MRIERARAHARRAHRAGPRLPRQARLNASSRTMRPKLPPQMHVFVRDWLSANHVVLASRDGGVVIDSGYRKHAPLTLALVASRMGLDGAPLAKLVNTHCHSDHMGGNAALAARLRLPDRRPGRRSAARSTAWDERTLLLDYADQRAERFDVDEVLQPGCDARLGRSRMARARGTGPRHGRARVLQRRAPHPDLRRRAVAERLRLRDAAGDRSHGAAGDARDARDDRGPRRPLRDSRSRRAVHRRRRRARARIYPHRGVRSRLVAHRRVTR